MNVCRIYKRLYWLYVAEYIKQRPLILVYYMAKVGSTSIQHSLILQGISPVYKIHVLNLENINILYPRNREQFQTVIRDDKRRNWLFTRALNRYIFAKHKPVKVITPVREPIARNISLFFENLIAYHIQPDSCHELYSIRTKSQFFV